MGAVHFMTLIVFVLQGNFETLRHCGKKHLLSLSLQIQFVCKRETTAAGKVA
jgi:hypothetical protein